MSKTDREYCLKKIEMIDKLIAGSSDNLERVKVYEGYKQTFLDRISNSKAEIARKIEEDKKLFIEKEKERLAKIAREEEAAAKKIEETQIETLKEIKESIDNNHADIVEGNKVRCPECLGMFTKGGAFAKHYQSHIKENGA